MRLLEVARALGCFRHTLKAHLVLDVLIEVLRFGLTRLLSQDWLHTLLLRLADPLDLVIALFLPLKRLQVEPLADCHA